MHLHTICQINYAFSLFKKKKSMYCGGTFPFLPLFSKLAKIFTLKDPHEHSASSIGGLENIMKLGQVSDYIVPTHHDSLLSILSTVALRCDLLGSWQRL